VRRFWRYQGVIRICKLKKNRQHNGQTKKRQKDKQQSTKHTHKTKDRVTCSDNPKTADKSKHKLTTSYWNIFNVISNSCVHQSFCWTASVSRWCNGYSGVQCIMSSISGLVKPKTMKLIVAASLLIKKY
jgi:hypothetical protein